MAIRLAVQVGKPAPKRRNDLAFTEAPAWSAIGAGWRPLFGSYRQLGFSFEWHEFTCVKELDWARSFPAASSFA
jgi:hypothetical protein